MGLLLTSLVLLCLLIVWGIFLKKRFKISWKLVVIGAVSFFLSVQVLEKLLHLLVLHPSSDGKIDLLVNHPLLYVFYSLVTAAVFEEGVRYLVFSYLKKKRHLEMKDGLAYGLGHGGIELLVLGLRQLLVYAVVQHALAHHQDALLTVLPSALLKQVEGLNFLTYLLFIIERMMALLGQTFLTLWVMVAVEKRKIIYLVGALLFHTLLDLPASLYQVGYFNQLWIVELIILSILFGLYLKTKKMLQENR